MIIFISNLEIFNTYIEVHKIFWKAMNIENNSELCLAIILFYKFAFLLSCLKTNLSRSNL